MQNAALIERLRAARRRRWRNYMTVGLRLMACSASAQLLCLYSGAQAARFARGANV